MIKMRGMLSYIVKPFIRMRVIGWGRLMWLVYGWPKAVNDKYWAGVVRSSRLPGSQVRVVFDLGDGDQRLDYFCGCGEIEMDLLLREILQLGDTFVDVGANRGIFTVLASESVGPNGRVVAIEPNPAEVADLRHVIATYKLDNVVLYDGAVGDEDVELVLALPEGKSSLGTLADTSHMRDESGASKGIKVNCTTLDSLLAVNGIDGTDVIKMDVQGFECKVLEGSAETLSKSKPIVITEVLDEWLTRAGDSAEKLFGYMHGFGYRGYIIRAGRAGVMGRYKARLDRADTVAEMLEIRGAKYWAYRNVIWVCPETPGVTAIARYIN